MGGKEILQLCVYVSLYALSERDRCPKNSSLSLCFSFCFSRCLALSFFSTNTPSLSYFSERHSLSLSHTVEGRDSRVCVRLSSYHYIWGVTQWSHQCVPPVSDWQPWLVLCLHSCVGLYTSFSSTFWILLPLLFDLFSLCLSLGPKQLLSQCFPLRAPERGGWDGERGNRRM